jgi:hypothetical protein
MKKLLAILLLICVCFGVTACDPTSYYHYNNSERIAEITAIELINYDYPDAVQINTFFSTRGVERFDFDRMTVLEVVGEDIFADFLQDLSEVKIWTSWIHSDSPFGICLRIIYKNGDFEVISADSELPFFALYNSRGRLRHYLGMFEENERDFAELVNKHFVTQIAVPD